MNNKTPSPLSTLAANVHVHVHVKDNDDDTAASSDDNSKHNKH
jgi:hypothetical protein